MTYLCIDWGNTLVKAAAIDAEGKFLEMQAVMPEDASKAIEELLEKHQPRASIFCSVVNKQEEALFALLQERSHFVELSTRTMLPIINAYHSESLGMDRLAAVAGIQAEHPEKNNLVIALGTCVTYNFITKNRAFRGGAISPGLQMRLDAMHQFTDKLPQVPAYGDTLLLGYDTPTCMRSGALFGLAAEIDGMVEAFRQEYGEINAVLTGGDAALLARHIKSSIFADPKIILKGLYQILKHNARFLR
ncbi:MAG: type III pantothenate kinase [Bacteroidetes bacterium]|nr:type III pantothenate kinase [Bacteroidota bacterium]